MKTDYEILQDTLKGEKQWLTHDERNAVILAMNEYSDQVNKELVDVIEKIRYMSLKADVQSNRKIRELITTTLIDK